MIFVMLLVNQWEIYQEAWLATHTSYSCVPYAIKHTAHTPGIESVNG
jgi:hypothetical protein